MVKYFLKCSCKCSVPLTHRNKSISLSILADCVRVWSNHSGILLLTLCIFSALGMLSSMEVIDHFSRILRDVRQTVTRAFSSGGSPCTCSLLKFAIVDQSTGLFYTGGVFGHRLMFFGQGVGATWVILVTIGASLAPKVSQNKKKDSRRPSPYIKNS